MDMNRAFSVSLITFFWIKEIAYFMNTAAHGNVRDPSLGTPNSSSAHLKRSPKKSLLRYSRGI